MDIDWIGDTQGLNLLLLHRYPKWPITKKAPLPHYELISHTNVLHVPWLAEKILLEKFYASAKPVPKTAPLNEAHAKSLNEAHAKTSNKPVNTSSTVELQGPTSPEFNNGGQWSDFERWRFQ